MKAHVDLEKCCGHGRCYALCPEVFDEDEEGYPVVFDKPIAPELESRVRQAAANCPEVAIAITEESEQPAGDGG